MRLILVRHAQTPNNAEGLMQTDDIALSNKGVRQALLVARRLMKEDIDRIYTSPHTRCQQTARAIAKFHDAIPIIDMRIRELEHGDYAGRPGHKFKEARTKANLPFGKWRPEGGENNYDVKERVKSFLDEMRCKDFGTVLVVSHGAPIAHMIMELLNVEFTQENYDTYMHDNAAITIVDFPNFEIIGCRNHLPENLQ